MRIVELSQAEWTGLCPSVDCVYLDPRWLDAVAAVYRRLPILRLGCRGDGPRPHWLLPLVAVRPLFSAAPTWISVAFGNYGGFIAAEPPTPEQWQTSLAALRDYFARSPASRLEIRGEEIAGPFQKNAYFKRFIVDLPSDGAELWRRGLSSNARNMVRKAEKAGLTTRVDPPGAEAIFQALYEGQAKEHGTPIHSLRWFPELRRRFGADCYILVAFRAGAPVGATFVLEGSRTAYLHAVCWSREHNDVPVADLLYWHSILESSRRGRARMDFGRTRPVGGQLFFKRKWGASETDLPYSYLLKPGVSIPLVVPEQAKYRLAIRLWQMIPTAVHRVVGPHLRVRIPS